MGEKKMPTNKLLGVTEEQQAEAERLERERLLAYTMRRVRRIEAWALKQSKDDLAELLALALAVVVAIERKKTKNVMKDRQLVDAMLLSSFSQQLSSQTELSIALAGKVIKTKQSLGKGGRARKSAEIMREIQDRWESENRPGAEFAKRMEIEMSLKYGDDSPALGSISNAISRWRKTPRPK